MFDWIEAHPASVALMTALFFAFAKFVRSEIRRGYWRRWLAKGILAVCGGIFLLVASFVGDKGNATKLDIYAAFSASIVISMLLIVVVILEIAHVINGPDRQKRALPERPNRSSK